MAKIAPLAPGAAGASRAPAGAAEPRRPPFALKFLQQGATGARPPGQGGKAEGKCQAGEAISEQIRQQEQGCAGLAGLAFAVDLQGGLIEHGAHLGLLLCRSLRLEQGQGLGDVGWTQDRALQVLKLLICRPARVCRGRGLGPAERRTARTAPAPPRSGRGFSAGGGMAERRWQNPENDLPRPAATKKPCRRQGWDGNQG